MGDGPHYALNSKSAWRHEIEHANRHEREIKAGRFGIGVNAPRRAEREGCGNF